MAYINILENTYYPGVSHNKQSRYHNVVYFTYWPVLGTYNSWNIINFTNIIRSKEDFDEIHKFDGISDNNSSHMKIGNYGAI